MGTLAVGPQLLAKRMARFSRYHYVPLFFLIYLSCSYDLWPQRNNPRNCVINRDACTIDENCNFITQACEPGGLALLSVSPPAGPTSGGIQIKLTGRKFMPGAVVRIAGQPAAPVQFVSDKELNVVLPSNPTAFGPAEIVIENPDGSIVRNSDLFHYFVTNFSFSTTRTTVQPVIADMAAADVNRDGNLDLILCQETAGSIAVYLGDGRGNFADRRTSTVGFGISRLGLGDFNQDGALDLAVLSVIRSNISTMLSNRDGTFSLHQSVAVTSSPAALLVGRFDGDDFNDVFVTDSSAGQLHRLFGNGTGTLTAAAPIDLMLTSFELGGYDMDGDGTVDFVLSSLAGQRVAVLQGDRSNATSIKGRQDWILPGYHPYTAAVGDFNKDGRNDFVSGSILNNTLHSVFANESGQYIERDTHSLGSGFAGPSFCRAFDLNGDGLLDILCSDSFSPNLALLLGNGLVGFSAPIVIPTEDMNSMDSSKFAVGDFDRNGKPDLVFISTSSTQFTVMLNQSF